MIIKYIKYTNETSNRFTKNRIYEIEDDDINYYVISDYGSKIIIHSYIIKGYYSPAWSKCTKQEFEIQIRKDKLKTIDNNKKLYE